MPKQSLRKVDKLLYLYIPPLLLLIINVFQLFLLPDAVISSHTTGSVKFAAWFSLYLATVLNLNVETAVKIKHRIWMVLIIVFTIGIFQYPLIVMQVGGGLGSAFSNYGQLGERYQLSGIFGSANEDANGFVTLLPLVLLWIENQPFSKRRILRWGLLLYFPLMLVFNGTRTALLLSFPLITILFYCRLSIKTLLYIIGPITVLISSTIFIVNNWASRFFSAELQGGGSFGWRVENVWLPAVEYTWS
ncbi:MAG: hypothetical protein AAFY76_21770, partial [Cyanobacteria bacterium J06649_11]